MDGSVEVVPASNKQDGRIGWKITEGRKSRCLACSYHRRSSGGAPHTAAPEHFRQKAAQWSQSSTEWSAALWAGRLVRFAFRPVAAKNGIVRLETRMRNHDRNKRTKGC